MPDGLAAVLNETLAMPGLTWVICVTLLAGLVYGFAGFGAALVFMPVASVFMPVEMAVAAFAVTALASLVTVVPRAWQASDKRAVAFMIAVAALSLPVGIYILGSNDVTVMRWAVLSVTVITLLALISGWRYTTRPNIASRTAVAATTGLVGGATGLVGPIMVLFQLSGQDGIARSRGNTLVFLTSTGLLTAPLMALQGMLSAQSVMLGLILLVPYGAAARLGQRYFDPNRETLYRRVAYAIIAAAVVMGLPVWD
ncbi:MAG: sulfite exporter TauE/SafE family protein [Pseudomonadota bacterium]